MKSRSTRQRLKALWIYGLLAASVLLTPLVMFQFGSLGIFGLVALVTVGLMVADGLHRRLIASLRRARRPANLKVLEQREQLHLEADGWIRVEWLALEQSLLRMKHDETPMAPYIRHFDYVVYLSLDFIQDVQERHEMQQRFQQLQNVEISPEKLSELIPLVKRMRAIADGEIAPGDLTPLTSQEPA